MKWLLLGKRMAMSGGRPEEASFPFYDKCSEKLDSFNARTMLMYRYKMD